MNQSSIQFIFLCYIFSSVINITVSVFARLYSRHKEFNLLIGYWIYFLAVFIYSFLFHDSLIEIASSYFLQAIAINILVQIVGHNKNWVRPLIYQAPAFLLSGFLLLKTNLGFTFSLIPAAIVLGVPFCQEAYETLVRRSKNSNWAEKAMGILFLIFALHNIDYLFLRLDPEAQLWGYSASLVIIQCVSLFVPLAINLRREELERQNITTALNRISGEGQNPSLEIEELYKSLTLQISQKEAFFRELREANSVLAEEKQVNELLIRTITHDLSGPLVNINNYCELLSAKKIEKENEQKIWERVNFNTQSALTKITNTKNALKTRDLAAGIQIEEVSLNQSIVELLALFDSSLKKKDLTCEFVNHGSGEIIILASASTLFDHVLSHVLSNAIKYSHRGQKIIISIEPQGDVGIVLEFRDFGTGLHTSAYEKRILSSLPGTEGELGNGLGIMIMGYFMRRFGGSYSLENPTDGPGTKVLLKFRRKASSVGATTKPLTSTQQS
jgi:signal transduction histidine kinase